MLTAKQGNFVELLSQGTSQTSAYKGTYDTQNMSDKTSVCIKIGLRTNIMRKENLWW